MDDGALKMKIADLATVKPIRSCCDIWRVRISVGDGRLTTTHSNDLDVTLGYSGFRDDLKLPNGIHHLVELVETHGSSNLDMQEL